MNVSVILPAAGLGTRMGREKSGTSRKQFMLLDGSPILTHTVRKFAASDRVSQIIVAVRPEDRECGNHDETLEPCEPRGSAEGSEEEPAARLR